MNILVHPMDTGASGEQIFWLKYKQILSKLKRRFLKKPNVSEASEEFGTLARQLENQEHWEYSGYCCLAVARCEQSLSNPNAEAAALLRASRLFLEGELESWHLKLPSWGEQLEACISCYMHASRIYSEQGHSHLAAALQLEAGGALQRLDKPLDAVPYIQKATEILKEYPLEHAHLLGILGSLYIRIGDYYTALEKLSEMGSIAVKLGGSNPNGIYAQLLVRSEIECILLLMIIEPPKQHMKSEHSRLLDKYSAEDAVLGSLKYLNEELHLYLMSLVLAWQSKDVESMLLLETDLRKHLNEEQRELCRTLMETMKKSSVT